MYKKWIALALALCLCLSLAACAQTPASSVASAPSSTAESKTDTSSTVEEATYPIVKDKITISGVVFGSQTTNTRITWDEMEKLTNIKVDWKIVPTDQKTVFIAAGDWPDLFHGGFDSALIEEWGVIGKKIVNFEDYADIMPNLQQTYKDYENYFAKKRMMASDGGIYNLLKIDNGPTSSVVRMHYNASLLEEYDLKVPTTVDEFHDVLVVLKEKLGGAPYADNVAATIWGSNGDYYFFSAFGPATSPDFYADANGKVVYGRISDQYRLTMQYLNQLYAEGLLHQEYLTLDNSTKASMINDRKLAFGADGWSSAEERAFNGDFEKLQVLAPLTSKYDSERKIYAGNVIAATGTEVNAESKYIKEICQMLDVLFATEEVAKGTGMYGIAGTFGPENVTWEWANADHTEYNFIIPDDYDASVNGVYQSARIIFSNLGRYDTFINAVLAGASNNRSRQLGYIKNTKPYEEEVPFVYGTMNEEETDVINNYMTEMKEYVKEWNAAFITGTKNPNDDAVWSEYCAGFDKLHLTEVTAAYQSAYTRFSTLD